MLLRVLSRTPSTDATSQLPDKAVAFELVWIAPLSPCHGVVQSPTFRDAPIDYGDLVLWDGAPVAAHKVSSDEPVPVFPLLEILRRGDERRLSFVALEREPGASRGLEEALPDGVRVFVQQERVAHQCAACDAGVPHEHGTEAGAATGTVDDAAARAAATGVSLVRGKAVVPAEMSLTEFRDAWEALVKARPMSVAIPGLYEELGDSKRAGQEHQAWRGIEGKAVRDRARS
jgi:hypothetical protein